MKINDVNALKGSVKDAAMSWGCKKIDELLKNRDTARMFAKRALGNFIARQDEKINSYVDNAFLLLADEAGSIDSDSAIDMFCGLLEEMKQQSYPLGPMVAKVGAGEVAFELPHNFLLDMFTGNMGVIKLTKDDFLELKNYF